MENASKALIMAAGVLVGVLVLSLAVYLFTDFGSKTADINKQKANSQLTSFNSQFTAYTDYKDKNGNWKITIYDIITLRGAAIENNKNYIDDSYHIINEDELIQVYIDGQLLINLIDGNNSINTPIPKDDQTLLTQNRNSDGSLFKFSCESENIKFNQRGKVKSITFHKL